MQNKNDNLGSQKPQSRENNMQKDIHGQKQSSHMSNKGNEKDLEAETSYLQKMKWKVTSMIEVKKETFKEIII